MNFELIGLIACIMLLHVSLFEAYRSKGKKKAPFLLVAIWFWWAFALGVHMATSDKPVFEQAQHSKQVKK